MTKGTGTYDDPIIVDGIFTKTIDDVKKFFKFKFARNHSILYWVNRTKEKNHRKNSQNFC